VLLPGFVAYEEPLLATRSLTLAIHERQRRTATQAWQLHLSPVRRRPVRDSDFRSQRFLRGRLRLR
jgi:hypothetical protein